MKIMNVTTIRKNIYRLLDNIAKSKEPIQIIGKRNSAILITTDEWNAIWDTLCIANVSGMKGSIIRGIKTPISKCHNSLL